MLKVRSAPVTFSSLQRHSRPCLNKHRFYNHRNDCYHLLFFDKGNKLQRAWLPSTKVSRFTGRDQKELLGKHKARYKASIDAALDWVDKAWPWEKKERKEYFLKFI